MAQNIDQSLEEVIQMRERGDLEGSRQGFELLREQIDKGHPSYNRLTGEFVIQLRLEGKRKLEQALSLGRELYNHDREKNIGDSSCIRAVSNALIDLGYFESAIPLLLRLSKYYKDNSLRLGEIQSHLAYAYLRTGRISESSILVETAIQNIEANTAKENYVEVRSSYSLMVRSLIELQLGEKKLALSTITQALSLAKKGKAIYRITQIEEVMQAILSG